VPVIDLITERLAVSLPLALIALALSTAIAIPVGLYAASRRGRAGDAISMGAAQLGVAVPNFWFALLLVYLFAVWLRWLPAGGFPGWSAGVWPALKALMLPALALALPQAAILARVTRSALVDVLSEDYIRTARAKGMPWRRVLWGHALRNAAVPLVTVIALSYAGLLEGSVLTETVFAWPGLGLYITNSLQNADMNAVLGGTIVIGSVFIAINLLSDVLYRMLDPRTRS
jgi:peptide/nickel transport system permease protein